jgi:nitrite reductase/ring-hydroxylating ferredoxin subunit
MINFKDFRNSLSESTESKPFKVGSYNAIVKKEKNKFVAYLDGDKFDSFNTMAGAKKALNDFVKLLDSNK